MKISNKAWQNYIKRLAKIDVRAAGDIVSYMVNHDVSTYEGTKALIDYAYAVSTKYGEAAAELSCQMYDAIAVASKAKVPAAEPASTATYGEIAKTIYGTMAATKNTDAIGAAVARSVKLASVDTLQKNALRDGAEWAWIPSGDSCPFCLMLASRGWVKASEKAIKNGHAEHVHSNCDCTYAVRHDSETTVEGYDPEALYKKYISAGETPRERLNALSREHYAANREYIRAQKRAAYAKRVEAARATQIRDNYSEEFDTYLRKNRLNSSDLADIQRADNTVSQFFQEAFPGYRPAELLPDIESTSIFSFITENGLTYRIERFIGNTAIPAGSGNVDIGNPALANSIHERAHDLINNLAMRRAGIIDENRVTPIQVAVFQDSRNDLISGAFINCFTDETVDQIYDIIMREISQRAMASGEFIPESMVAAIGAQESHLARKVYEYFREEWDK